MNSQTSLVAEQYRLHEWAAQIRNCQNRPAGMSVADWCSQNQISVANYYYRFRRVREACIESIQESSSTFVELPTPKEDFVPDSKPDQKHAGVSAVLRFTNGTQLELLDNASADFMKRLMETLANA